MKPTLASGLSSTVRITVDRDRTIGFMGDSGRVYATPQLVKDIEVACREYLLGHLDSGEDSVGTHVSVDHLAPTLLGMWVELTLTVAEVKGRLVTFDVTARDAVDTVARGRHVRFVSDVKKTLERLQAKAAKIQAVA